MNPSSYLWLNRISLHPAFINTKFALEVLSESITYELEPFGIKVVIVEPDMIKTKVVAGLVI